MFKLDSFALLEAQKKRLASFKARYGADVIERIKASGRTSGIFAMAVPLWVLTGPSNDYGLGRDVISGTPDEIREAIRDGLPPGWKVLKGQAARAFLDRAIRAEEARWKAGIN
jgi:hypothetical protein